MPSVGDIALMEVVKFISSGVGLVQATVLQAKRNAVIAAINFLISCLFGRSSILCHLQSPKIDFEGSTPNIEQRVAHEFLVVNIFLN